MSTSPFHRDDVPSAPTLNSIPSLPNMDSVPPLSYPYNVPSLPSQDSFPSLPNLNNVSSLPSQNSVPSLPQHPSMLLHSRMTSYSLLTAGDQDHASLININREAYAHFLCTAAREGRTETVKQYLKSAYYTKTHRSAVQPINRLDNDEVGALHYAARYNHVAVMQILIDHNADVNNPAQDDLTPLHYAARYTPKGTAPLETEDGIPISVLSAVDEEDEDGPTDDIALTRPMAEIIAEDFGSPPIKFLLDNGADVNAKDKYGLTAVHCAADRGNYAAVVQLLRSNSIAIEVPDKQGETPLHLAVRANSIACVRKLLEVGANPNCQTYSLLNPLHSACTEGNLEIVQLLYETMEEIGIPNFINQGNEEWMTPLHFAVEVGAVDVVNFIVDKGADVQAKRNNLDTVLHMAASHGFTDIASKVVASGKADLDAKNIERMTPLHCAARMDRKDMIHLLIDKEADIEAVDKEGRTPLIMAAGWGQMAAVKLLLDTGADVSARDKRDKTAIFHAVEENRSKVLRLLLEKRGNENLGNEIDRFQNTPIHLAAQLGFISCVKVLLEFGFAVDAQNEDDMCPLHLAALHGRILTAKELVRWDPAIVNDEDEIANTPLHYAAQAGHVKTVVFLTEESADVDAKNQFGWTPMDSAAACGMTKTLAALLDAGAEVDPIDKNKTTPLHLAAKNGHVDTVQYLLDHEANIRLTDTDGNNALELATMHTKTGVAECIISHKKWYAAMENKHPDRDTPMKKLIRLMPDVAMQVFNKCVDDNCNPEHITNDREDYQVEFDYRYLDVMESDGEEDDDENKSSISKDAATPSRDEYQAATSHSHPLQVMVKTKRIELLDHPLVQSLIYSKWERYGKWFYYFNLALYTLYLFSLTGYASNQIAPYSFTEEGKVHNLFGCTSHQLSNQDTEKVRCCFTSSLSCASQTEDDESCCYSNFWVWPCGLVVIITSALRLVIELAQFGVQRFKYFGINNAVENLLFLSSIYFCVAIFGSNVISDMQWQIGVFSVFVAWMNLIMFLRKFPKIGVYIVMFVTVLITFLQIVIILVIFLIAFALSFNMVLDKFTAFSHVLPSIMKTFVMMTGELEYDGYYVDEQLYYPESSYALFICFVIVVPIVFMNLLVGLAVDDIKEVQRRAGLERSVMKIQLIFQVENMLPRSYLLRVNQKKAKFFVNQGKPLFGGLLCGLTIQDKSFDGDTIKLALQPKKTGVEELKSCNEVLEKNVRKMRHQIDDLSQQNVQILRLLHSLTRGADSETSDDVDQDLGPASKHGESVSSSTLDDAAKNLVADHKMFGRWNRRSQHSN